MPVDPQLAQLLHGFVDESQEICDRITHDLLELERGERDARRVPQGTFDDLARGLHTLKGSAATLGLDELADVAHKMEDVVAPLRRRATLPATVADALLRSLDSWMSRLRATAAGAPLPDLGATADLLASALASDPGGPRSPSPVSAAPARSPSPVSAAPARSPSPLSTVAAESPTPASAPPAAGTRRTASSAGDISITGEDPAGEATWRIGTRQVAALLHDVERLREVRLRLEDRQRELDRAVQQLARIRRQLRQTGSGGPPIEIPGGAEARAAVASVSRGLSADVDETSDIVASLEDGLKSISTQPMRTILEPLRRAVRDLCRQSGKQVTLSVVGGEVSLDRRLLEALRSPLVHLVRNAVDHGIELPETRERAGKHAEGALVVRVEQQGNMLFLEVADDGAGVDLEKIREAALQRGLHTADELAAMTPTQLQQLIFRPGFSTRATISELSGRGVGLDIVRSEIQALEGQVEVQSVAGQGARFILSLPADLGSSAVLVVRCGEQQLGIPTLAIESSRAVRAADVSGAADRMRYAHRDDLIPLYDLGALLRLREPELPRSDQPLLILGAHGRRIALAVDDVLGDREVVIRPLPHEVRDVPAYGGAATLARGELLLILRPDWLASAGEPGGRALAPALRALVVDDSLTARTMHRAALENGGFLVHTASDAAQALERLACAPYDVLVADVRMEGMDGFGLLAAVRARAETAALPVVIVSSLEGAAELKRARDEGADTFITKKDCGAGKLLLEVQAALERRRKS